MDAHERTRVKKCLSAEAIDTDDKNLCDIFKSIRIGKLRCLCYEHKVEFEYNDYVFLYSGDKEIENSLGSMSFKDANIILIEFSQVVKDIKN